jgi:hypothetical protein
MPVKLSSKLPDPIRNGLTAIEAELVGEDQQRTHVVIALVSRSARHVDDENRTVTPTVSIRAIEVVREDFEVLARLLRRAHETRIGAAVLPFDTEEEIRGIFNGVDLETGEIVDEGTGDDRGES